MFYEVQYTRHLLSGIVLLSATSYPGKCEQTKQPNVILIVVDDLGIKDLGCYGNTYVATPTIDSLSSQGAMFVNAYAASSLCSPSRAALLTGKTPARTGITNRIAWWRSAEEEKYRVNEGKRLLTPVNYPNLPLHNQSLAEVLSDNGYVCGHVGKWHLGGEGSLPEDHGFKINIGGNYRGDIPQYNEPFYGDHTDIAPFFPEMLPGEYLTDYESRMAVNFIRDHADTTFFLNLWHYAVHTPLQAKQHIVEKYSKHGERAAYFAMIEHVDDALKTILDELKRLGISDKTIVIFTSDNGGLAMPYAAENGPYRAGKGYPYEGGIRVPLILFNPGQINPLIIDLPVSGYDLMPTILELVGITTKERDDLDGISLCRYLNGDIIQQERPLFWHFPHYRENQYTGFGVIEPYSIVLFKGYKLIIKYDSATRELYDIVNDIAEEKNLVLSHPEIAEELTDMLREWLFETKAKLPVEKELTGRDFYLSSCVNENINI
jgi:arylsulfatase A